MQKAHRLVMVFAMIAVGMFVLGGCSLWEREQPATTGTIQGRIVDESGNPAQGVTVTVGGKNAVTDDNGLYSLSGIEPGTYTIAVSSKRFSAPPSLPEVTVEVGRTVMAQEIVMSSRYGFDVNMDTGGLIGFYGSKDLVTEIGLMVWAPGASYKQAVGQGLSISQVLELSEDNWKFLGTFASADLSIEVDLVNDTTAEVTYTVENNTSGMLWSTMAVGGMMNRAVYQGATVNVVGFYDGVSGVSFDLEPHLTGGVDLFTGSKLWAKGYEFVKPSEPQYYVKFERDGYMSGGFKCYENGYLFYVNVSSGLSAGEEKMITLTVILGADAQADV